MTEEEKIEKVIYEYLKGRIKRAKLELTSLLFFWLQNFQHLIRS